MTLVAKVAAFVFVMLLLATSAALAVTKKCDGGGCSGTTKADTLYGTAGFDRIYGGKGADTIYGAGTGDNLRGGPGRDIIYDGAGDDNVVGGLGRDRLSGKAGADRLRGGHGNDLIAGKTGTDHMYGEHGDDVIHGSLDRQKDYFYCGPGRDEVVVGTEDFVAQSCEIVDIND